MGGREAAGPSQDSRSPLLAQVVPIPTGTQIPAPGTFSSAFTSQLRAQASTMPLLKGKEDSECCERVCCPLYRGLKLPFVDGAGQTFLTLERPW